MATAHTALSTPAGMSISHHALLCVGRDEACMMHVPVEHRSGIDAEMFVREQFEIDDARTLTEKATTRPVLASKRSFILSCTTLTHEAQNALLKLFEDPPATAQFYLIVPRAEVLLPTLRSRLHLWYAARETGGVATEALQFLAATPAERLRIVATLAKEKDTSAMRALIRAIEAAFEQKLHTHPDTKGTVDLLLAARYNETRGASHKMLLEHLALSFPTNMFS